MLGHHLVCVSICHPTVKILMYGIAAVSTSYILISPIHTSPHISCTTCRYRHHAFDVYILKRPTRKILGQMHELTLVACTVLFCLDCGSNRVVFKAEQFFFLVQPATLISRNFRRNSLVSCPDPTHERSASGDNWPIPRASLTLNTFWREISLYQSHCRKRNLSATCRWKFLATSAQYYRWHCPF